jgi:hypothetical protein
MTPNPECARRLAEVLWAMTQANALDGLHKVLRVVAEHYGPEFAAAFADQVIAEMRAMPTGQAH